MNTEILACNRRALASALPNERNQNVASRPRGSCLPEQALEFDVHSRSDRPLVLRPKKVHRVQPPRSQLHPVRRPKARH